MGQNTDKGYKMLGIYSTFSFCLMAVLSKIGKYKISNTISISTSLYPSGFFQHVILSLGHVFAILVVFMLKLLSCQNETTFTADMLERI